MNRGQVAELERRIHGWKLVLEMANLGGTGVNTVESRQQQLALAGAITEASGTSAAVPIEVQQHFERATDALQRASHAGAADAVLVRVSIPETAAEAKAEDAELARMRVFIQGMLTAAERLLAHTTDAQPLRTPQDYEAWLETERALRAEEANCRAAFEQAFPAIQQPDHLAMAKELQLVALEANRIAKNYE